MKLKKKVVAVEDKELKLKKLYMQKTKLFMTIWNKLLEIMKGKQMQKSKGLSRQTRFAKMIPSSILSREKIRKVFS